MLCIFNDLNVGHKLCISHEDSVGSKRPQEDDAPRRNLGRMGGGMARPTRTQTSDVSVGLLVAPSFLLGGALISAAVWATPIRFNNVSPLTRRAANAFPPLGGTANGRDLESVARS